MKKVRVIQGESWRITAPFRVGDLILEPDSGNVTVVTRSNGGAIVDTQDVLFNALPVSVPASALLLGSGQTITHYHSTITFQSGGLEYIQRVLIEVVKFLPLIYTEYDVLNLLGVTEQELETDSINFYMTKESVELDLGITLFDDEALNLTDNKLVLYKAALEQMPTLVLKAKKEKRIDDHADERFRVDFAQVQSQLQGEYTKLRNTRLNQDSIAEPLLTAVQTVDIITGQ